MRRRAIVPALHKRYLAAMLDMFGDCAAHGARQLDAAAKVGCGGTALWRRRLPRWLAARVQEAAGARLRGRMHCGPEGELSAAARRACCSLSPPACCLTCLRPPHLPRHHVVRRRAAPWRWRTSSPASGWTSSARCGGRGAVVGGGLCGPVDGRGGEALAAKPPPAHRARQPRPPLPHAPPPWCLLTAAGRVQLRL